MDKSIGTDRQSSSSGWGKNKIPCAKNRHAGNSFFFVSEMRIYPPLSMKRMGEGY